MQDSPSGPRWYEGLTARHWMVLAVASAGWVFDVYEGQLFTIFKTPMLTELGWRQPGGDRVAGKSRPGGLFARRRGRGLFFGVLGDRFGRVRIMAYTILVYSLFSALTAFATVGLASTGAPVSGGARRRGRMGDCRGPGGRDLSARTRARPRRESSMRPACWAGHSHR